MAKAQTAITYCRVSSQKQGASGLGLEAQREAVTTFAACRKIDIVAEYTEVESGKKESRPQLVAALDHAKRIGAVLLIAKLDRLARNVALISTLMEAKTDFLAVDAPYANRLMIHIMAAFAEHEREQISARTKAALAAAKARGVVMGRHSEVLKAKAVAEAISFAKSLEISEGDIFRAGGTVREIAARLNQRGVRTREGGSWGPGNTSRLITRLGPLSQRADNACHRDA